jgi:transposase
MPWKPLTDLQWAVIEPLIPKQKRGRPRSRDREILDAILFVLWTGIRWEELAPGFPPKSTVHDRFQVWLAEGFFERLFEALRALKPPTDGCLYYLDATIKSAKGGPSGRESRENKGQQNKPRQRRERIA